MFYPVEIHEGTRPDIIADAYYQDSELDWMVYLSNIVIDPYYDWYLDESDFQKFIIDKYNSIDEAQQRIIFYRNNWPEDDGEISPSFYENNLAWDQKQYYSPIFGAGAKIVAYNRKRVDWKTNTNKIHQYTVTFSTGSEFNDAELIYVHAGSTSASEIQGNCEIMTQNSTTIIVKNISGNSIANTTWEKTFVGRDSGVTATSAEYVVLQENITNAEADFWSGVSYYDWEREENEAKKHIYILNPEIVRTISSDITRKINE